MRIVKRDPMAWYYRVAIRAAAIASALLLSALIILLLAQKNPLVFYSKMFREAFGSSTLIWSFAQNVAILLCISLAVTPAFKMRFWNIGAEGQALIGGLATVMVMAFCGGKLPTPILLIVMVSASILGGIIWAVLPAVAKALWNTNETLFTLMMNYVAIQLVLFFLKIYVKDGSGVLTRMPEYGLPVLFGKSYLLNIIIVAMLTVLVYVYLKYTKHGYEISVVGESENTARYIGIDVKKVVIRTMIISGALCGIAGLLLVGGTSHTIDANTTIDGRGFTAIMVSWLGKFNPAFMVLTSCLIVFLDKAGSAAPTFGMSDAIADIVTGIILFFIIGCEFFLQYKLVFNHKRKENE